MVGETHEIIHAATMLPCMHLSGEEFRSPFQTPDLVFLSVYPAIFKRLLLDGFLMRSRDSRVDEFGEKAS
jgi:hypothetical protein